MLDREAIALQCSLLSAQACGLESVQDHRLHLSPLADTGQQDQQSVPEQQPRGSADFLVANRDLTSPRSSQNSAAQPQVSHLPSVEQFTKIAAGQY